MITKYPEYSDVVKDLGIKTGTPEYQSLYEMAANF
jgi:hypothetical protein